MKQNNLLFTGKSDSTTEPPESTLQMKVFHSIQLIRSYEKLALKYSPDGFHVAFSGGKDSQVIYELCRMANVKFKAYFYKTSVDPPELLRFIRHNYPSVTWLYPTLTMFQLILKKKILPLRTCRFCCDYLKERRGLNELVILGIRKEESWKRAQRKTFTLDCKLGKDKVLLSPILEWTTAEVFEFLQKREIKVCEIYNYARRIGCIGCPMESPKQKDGLKRYPLHRKAYINTIRKLREQHDRFQDFESAEEVFNWWCSGKTKKQFFAQKQQLKMNLETENTDKTKEHGKS